MIHAMNGDMLPPRPHVRHYYGDTVRILFVAIAIAMVVGETTGAALPLSATTAVIAAITFAVAAGITNPGQKWIHYINEALAILGALIFTTSAALHWRAGAGFFDPSYFFTELVAILSIIALYFTTKTLRGLLLRETLS